MSAMDRNKELKMKSPVRRPISTGAKGQMSAMGRNKKLNMKSPVRRPISTGANSAEESVIKNVSIETKNVEAPNRVSNDGNRVLKTVSVASAEKHSLSLEVGASVIQFIRGREGSTRKRIEEEMGVKIILPWSRKEDFITIEGASIESVTKASEKIQTIIDEAARSPSLNYSHFVSLPLAIHPELVDKLEDFQNTIMGIGDKVDIKSIPLIRDQPKATKTETKTPTLLDLGIERSIFIEPKTFHLTVLMLKLWNKGRVHAATEVLKSISSSVMDALDNRPLSIKLEGLDCFGGSPDKARVVYAPVKEVGNEGRLLRACHVIIDAFVKAGLVVQKDVKHSLKLHATLMNANHRKRGTSSRRVDSFDARGIFNQFESKKWGKYLIREAHLSQRFVYDESGYYHCCASIPFP